MNAKDIDEKINTATTSSRLRLSAIVIDEKINTATTSAIVINDTINLYQSPSALQPQDTSASAKLKTARKSKTARIVKEKTWVEKYRPTDFTKIVLTDYNKHFFSQMIEKNIIPNLLFYGPPGTGKTTTIINLIKIYQQQYNQEDPSLIMHLNASDDRGIDTIRIQIMNFVNSQTLFTKGLKFVVLDEVDYMTKNAQLALKQLINITDTQNCRFCLICNYISKLDISLQSDFITIRFNDLPKEEVISYLNYINVNEKLDFSKEDLENIQGSYRSDMRSMINYIQNHSNIPHNNIPHNNTNTNSNLNLNSNTTIDTDVYTFNRHFFINDKMLNDIYIKNLQLSIKEFIEYINKFQHIDNTIILKNYINFLVDICINKNDSNNIINIMDIIEELKIIYCNINSNIESITNYWFHIYYLVTNYKI